MWMYKKITCLGMFAKVKKKPDSFVNQYFPKEKTDFFILKTFVQNFILNAKK